MDSEELESEDELELDEAGRPRQDGSSMSTLTEVVDNLNSEDMSGFAVRASSARVASTLMFMYMCYSYLNLLVSY